MQRFEHIILPAEWCPQSGVQLTWPHEDTDWAPILDEVIPCFVAIAKAIMKHERLLVVCRSEQEVRAQLGTIDEARVRFVELPTNDTWARDHAGISIITSEGPALCDFVFNGWGLKFPADKDNLLTRRLFECGVFASGIRRLDKAPFVLEGGSIESDGRGTLMTTTNCLLSVNRNTYLTRDALEKYLKDIFGMRRVLWVEHGYLAGDDTDSHIDTLARFCDEETIAYVQCKDESDEHYEALKAMEEQLKTFMTEDGKPYRLVPLPMADEVRWNGERLPATYANFLIINDAVLMPFYNSPKDEEARALLQQAFPTREVIGICCLPLIKQHGSLHCVTMQYPEGYIR